MRRFSRRSVRNVGAGALASALLVGTFLTPAAANYAGQSNAHVFNQHIKALADARYDRVRVGGHVRNASSTNATALNYSNVEASPVSLGGFGFTVPAGQTWFAVAMLTAESNSTSAGAEYCVIDVLVDGGAIVARPNVGNDFAFDSTDGGTRTSSGWQSLAMRRVTDAIGPGFHTIDFIGYVTNAAANHRIDDLVSSVDYYRAS